MAKAEKRAAAPTRRGYYALGPLVFGLFLAAFGLFWALALVTVDVKLDPAEAAVASPAGLAGAWLAFGALMTLGPIASYTLVTLLVMWGVRIYRHNEVADTWPQVLGGVFIVVAAAFLSAASADRYDLAQGGLLLDCLGVSALAYFGRAGIFCIAGLTLGLGIILAFGEAACRWGAWLSDVLAVGGRWLAATLARCARGGFRLGGILFHLLRNGAREGWRRPVPLVGDGGESTARAPGVAGSGQPSGTASAAVTADRAARTAVARPECLPVPAGAARLPESARDRGQPGAATAVAGEREAPAAKGRRGRRQVVVEIEEMEERSPRPEANPAAARVVDSRMNAAEAPEDEPVAPVVEERTRLTEEDLRVPEPAVPASPAGGKAPAAPRAERSRIEDAPDAGPVAAERMSAAKDDRTDDVRGDAFDTRDLIAAARRAAAPVDVASAVDVASTEEDDGESGETAAVAATVTADQGDGETMSPEDFYAIDEVIHDNDKFRAEQEAKRRAETERAAARERERIDRIAVKEAEFNADNYVLPSLDILDAPPPPVTHNRLALEKRSKILEQTLSEFKIDGKVVHIERGPRVTMYEISLAPGIKLRRVTELADNIAMMLRAQSVRMIAPIPGKDTIGIEIPNLEKDTVSLREIVETVDRKRGDMALPLALGKDVSGKPLVADLARMPHLLIAGATGSGKSVCINSIIMSILSCRRPDEVKLIMVDPKVVELSRFRDIPHLMCPVITDMKRSVAVLDWVCQKMDERYEQMAMVGVNNIAKFNALGADAINKRLSGIYSPDELCLFPKHMPYMIVIIDELADLMMVAGKEVEHHIMRLTAKSRAVGIHLLLATQRPSVNVITGLIKANMPSRIAFQVASRVDSQTILDQKGAETLLGAGDMLFLPPGVGRLARAQGVFVSDEELFRVVDYAKAQAKPQYHADLEGPIIGGGTGGFDLSDMDELFLSSGEAIIESQRGSVSLLQRKLGIGYGRASRIIDQLASAGVLGPFRDGKAREILMTLDEFTAKFAAESGKAAARRLTLDDDDNAFAGLRSDERARDQGAPWDDDGD